MHQPIVQTLSIERQFVAPRLKVVQRGRRHRRRRLRAMIAPFLLFLTLLAQISIRIQLFEAGYELETLRAEALKKDTQLRQLKLDLAISTRPADIARLAQEKSGLTSVDPRQVRALLRED